MRMLKQLGKFLLTLLGLFLIWQIIIRIVRKFILQFPAPAFIGRFLDSDLRRRMQPPDAVVTRSGVRPGMKILEVGCGSGAYTTFVAQTAGETGMVVGLDIQAAMLAQLQAKLRRPDYQGLTNIRPCQASAVQLPFADGSLDLVYMITVLDEIPNPQRALQEVQRVLKPGGTLAVTEFLVDPDYPLRRTTIRRGLMAGFELDEAPGNLWNYTVRFIKPLPAPGTPI